MDYFLSFKYYTTREKADLNEPLGENKSHKNVSLSTIHKHSRRKEKIENSENLDNLTPSSMLRIYAKETSSEN